MEIKEEASSLDTKPKLEGADAEPPPVQTSIPTVIRRAQITPAGTIIENTDDQPPDASTEEVVNTSGSPSQQSPVEQKVELQDDGHYTTQIIHQETHEIQEVIPENFSTQGGYAPSFLISIPHEIESTEYANLQTATSYSNGYTESNSYMIPQNNYQEVYLDRGSAENSPPSGVMYRGDPSLSVSSPFQVGGNIFTSFKHLFLGSFRRRTTIRPRRKLKSP